MFKKFLIKLVFMHKLLYKRKILITLITFFFFNYNVFSIRLFNVFYIKCFKNEF